MGVGSSRRTLIRWATRVACAAVALGLAFACAPILGIEDVTYADAGGGADTGTNDGSTLGDGGFDANVDCGAKAACGGQCANLTSDQNHCGKCGFACGGGDCIESKCKNVILAQGLVGPHGIAVDDTYAYVTVFGANGFGVADAGSIVRIPLEGGVVETLVAPVAEPAFILVRDGKLVWGNLDGFGSSLVDGGSLASVVTDAGGHFFGLTEAADPSVFAVNPYGPGCVLARWTPGAATLTLAAPAPCGRIVIRDGTTLYSTNIAQTGISVLALDGSAGPPVAAAIATWGLAQDSEYIYATEWIGAPARLLRIAKDGGAETTLATGLNFPRVVLADDTSLYVGDFENSQVLRFAKDGGARENVGAGAHPNGMALSNGFLYWVANGSGTAGPKDGEVRRVRVQ